MRRKIVLFLSVFFSLSAFASLAQTDPAPQAANAGPQHIQPATQRGTLYRVTHQGNTAYLFGTIHVGKPAFLPLEGEALRALAEATTLVVELDTGNSASFQGAIKKYGMYGAGDTIEKHLSSDSLKQLRQGLDRAGIALQNVVTMKPWFLANVLLALDLEHNGYQRRHGTENFLLAFAKTHAKTVQELETADYQLSLFDSMTENEQEQYMNENLAAISDGDALKKARSLIDAWGKADGTALEALLRDERDEKTLSAAFTQRMLLDKRNPEMTDKIDALLKHGASAFIAVGLLHLLGEQGLPMLLQQRGYVVQKLY